MTNSPFSQNREAADILSATNRYTAQHFKAETKRHFRKIMNKKKTKTPSLLFFNPIISELTICKAHLLGMFVRISFS